jgi:hypothetical protein
MANKKLVAYSIDVDATPGIANYMYTEGENSFVTTFAISGTKLVLNTVIDDHYENLETKVNGNSTTNTPEFIVSQDIRISLQCNPKDYRVSFDLREKGDSSKAEEQTITYLHKAERPAAQYWQKTGEIISG